MGYYIHGEIRKLDIKIPVKNIQKVLDIDEEFGYTSLRVSWEGLELDIGEGEVSTFPRTGDHYHLTDENCGGFQGNKIQTDELLENLAIAFGGTVDIYIAGEDGEAWAVRVTDGVKKRVKVAVVEEEGER
jgi:hypothetical protein